MRTLNLGILAHVDAGKTTLTERLLFTAGAIDHVGSVDAGTTQTDSLELERERGITIRSAVASFLVGDLAVNLVDTPGHPDFIAEVERVLGVLDGAVLVVSAVEGVQPQTPLLFRALQRLACPDADLRQQDRPGGRRPRARRRGDGAPALAGGRPDGTVRDAGRREATVDAVRRGRRGPSGRASRRSSPSTTRRSSGRTSATRRGCPSERLREQLAVQTRRGRRPPGRSSARRRRGSASTRCSPGIDELLGGAQRRSGRTRLGPRVQDRADRRRASASPTPACSPARCGRASACRVGGGGGEGDLDPGLRPGRRAASRRRHGRGDGDDPRARRRPGGRRDRRAAAGRRGRRRASRARRSRPWSSPGSRSSRARCGRPSAQLAEQDPLIDVRQDDHRHEISVSLYGEVQKEVIQATLERDYGIAADFRETTTVCIERPARVGEAEEVIRAKTHTNITGPQLAAQHEPVHGDAGPPDRARAVRLRGRVPRTTSSRASSRSTCSRPLETIRRPRWRRTSARRSTEGLAGLAGDRLPGHDDRLRLRLAGHVARPTSGGSRSSC